MKLYFPHRVDNIEVLRTNEDTTTLGRTRPTRTARPHLEELATLGEGSSGPQRGGRGLPKGVAYIRYRSIEVMKGIYTTRAIGNPPKGGKPPMG